LVDRQQTGLGFSYCRDGAREGPPILATVPAMIGGALMPGSEVSFLLVIVFVVVVSMFGWRRVVSAVLAAGIALAVVGLFYVLSMLSI
jgi:hypothetical protein